jgi:hypothetical protein
MIAKKATFESAKEVWEFGRTLGFVCEGDEEEVSKVVHGLEVAAAHLNRCEGSGGKKDGEGQLR